MSMNPKFQKGCVLGLDFNENQGDTVYDLSENGNNGTINGALWTRGIGGFALSFDGVDDYIRYVGQVFDIRDTKQITIMQWINVYVDNTQTPPSAIKWHGTYYSRYNTDSLTIWCDIPIFTTTPPVTDLHHYIGGKLKTDCSTLNYYPKSWDLFSSITKGWSGWIFHGFSVDATDETAVKIIDFVNDEFYTTTADLSDRYTAFSYPTTNPCALSNSPFYQNPKNVNSADPWWKMKGSLFRIYSRALSQKEIQEHYYYWIETLRSRIPSKFISRPEVVVL